MKNPFNVNGLVNLTYDQFRYAFANVVDESEAKRAYERYGIPGPTRPLIQAALANFNPNAVTKVDYENAKRAPLLFVAGGKDNIVPPSVNKENFKRYHTLTETDYREFPDRAHYTFGEPGWEEVADYCLNWAVKQSGMFENRPTIH